MNLKKTSAFFLTGILCIALSGGCAQKQEKTQQNESETVSDTNTTLESTTKENDAPDILSLGEFSLEDITGTAYTNEMFQDYKLTMINVFTTWCTPCINEIPDLEKLHQEMKEQGVNVVGVVLDATDEAGNKNEETLEKAKLLAERTGATYPFLIPDAGALNGRLKGIEAVPETFFVDKDGTIVGKTYSGSHSLEDWKAIVQTQLDGLKGDAS